MNAKQKIEELRGLDTELQLFGVKTHRYELTRAAPKEVAAFEQQCHCRLPESYRKHIIEVGTGCGPYHDLLTLEKIRHELESVFDSYGAAFPKDADLLGREFQLESQIAAMIESVTESSNCDDLTFDAPKELGGFIPICEQGCEFMAVMIIGGKFDGYVFDSNYLAMGGAEWRPAKRPPGMIPMPDKPPMEKLTLFTTFDRWFDSWLEHCFYDLEA